MATGSLPGMKARAVVVQGPPPPPPPPPGEGGGDGLIGNLRHFKDAPWFWSP